MGMGRAMRAMMAFQQIKALYETAAAELPGGGAGLPYDELVSHPAMLEIHNKGAQKALEVCRANRGAYSCARARACAFSCHSTCSLQEPRWAYLSSATVSDAFRGTKTCARVVDLKHANWLGW